MEKYATSLSPACYVWHSQMSLKFSSTTQSTPKTQNLPIPEFPSVSINSGPCRILNLDEWNPEWHCIPRMCRLDDSAAFARYTTAVLCSPAKRPEIPSGFKTLDVLRVCRASSEWKPRWKTPNNPSGNNGAIAFCQCMQQEIAIDFATPITSIIFVMKRCPTRNVPALIEDPDQITHSRERYLVYTGLVKMAFVRAFIWTFV